MIYVPIFCGIQGGQNNSLDCNYIIYLLRWHHGCFHLLQAQDDLKNDDMQAAGRRWRTACQWPYYWMIIWVVLVLTVELSLAIILPIIL